MDQIKVSYRSHDNGDLHLRVISARDDVMHVFTNVDDGLYARLVAAIAAGGDSRFLFDKPHDTYPAITAEPFTARQCPACGLWVYVAGGPFAEGDPTKPVADFDHWDAKHTEPEVASVSDGIAAAAVAPVVIIGRPSWSFNEKPVDAARPADTGSLPMLTAGIVATYFGEWPAGRPVGIDDFIALHSDITGGA